MKHVLILGAGRVARPCVQYLQKFDWLKLTVVEAVRENLARVTGDHPRTTALNQALPEDLAGFIASRKADLVINLLPAASMSSLIFGSARSLWPDFGRSSTGKKWE